VEDKKLLQRMREISEDHAKHEQGGGSSEILDEAAHEIERLNTSLYVAHGLLREWLNTELDFMDKEFTPWVESFAQRINAELFKMPNGAELSGIAADRRHDHDE
jgi:hypothetical protein